jgi:hypothetical protein
MSEIQRAEEEPNQNNLSPENILEMSPRELADLFSDLDEKGELQSFLENSAENLSLVAQLSYWEKWLEKDQRKLVDKAVAKKREVYEGDEDKDSLPLHLEKRFTPEELSLIFSSTGSIQLCFGCSKGCPFCAFDAVPGVREHIPYSQLVNLFQKYGKELGKGKPILYWASEPSDYASKMGLEDKTYQDIHQLAVQYAGYNPGITSKETNDEEWLDFLSTQKEAGSPTARVSVFDKSPEKIAEFKEKYGGTIFTVGAGISHLQGMGASIEQEKSRIFEQGIGCINGIFLTPRGIYGVAQVAISSEFPQGQVISPLETISEIEIKPGDELKRILRHSIITAPINDLGQQKSPISSHNVEGFSSGRDFFKGKFRKLVEIRTKDSLYRVWYDENGIVQSASLVGQDEQAEERETEEALERYKEKHRKDFEEISRRHQEAQESKKSYAEIVEEQREKFVSMEVNDAIKKAIEENRFNIEDEHLTPNQILQLKNTILQTDMSLFKPFSLSSKDKITGWGFRDREGWSFPGAGNIKLKISYDEGDKLILNISSDRSQVEAKEKEKHREYQEVNSRVLDAIKRNKVDFLTNYSDSDKQKIIQKILEEERLYKESRISGFEYEVYFAEIEVPEIGKVHISLTFLSSDVDGESGKEKSARLCVL